MEPHEIVRKLGEHKFKEMFLSLNAAAMKASMNEAKLQAVRSATQTSTRRRNEDWAKRMWATLHSSTPAPCKLFLFEWLRQTKVELLTAFLDAIGVQHDRGLTDADFMKDVPEQTLIEAGRALLAHPKLDRREVAAYLMFLDYSNETTKFASLGLETQLL